LTTEDTDAGFAEWKAILTEMAEGFRAGQRMDDFPDEFVQEMDTSTGLWADLGLKDREYDWEKIKAYQAGERAKLENALDLMKKYFSNLWD
jgi:hypothetical protein